MILNHRREDNKPFMQDSIDWTPLPHERIAGSRPMRESAGQSGKNRNAVRRTQVTGRQSFDALCWREEAQSSK
jgi:hypothetical protein